MTPNNVRMETISTIDMVRRANDKNEKGRRNNACKEGPGQSAAQSAYHDPQLDKLN